MTEIISKQQEHSYYRIKKNVGKILTVLIEKSSKKSEDFWSGRSSQNTVVVFPKSKFKIGDFVKVKIINCTSATLIGEGLGISKTV